LNLVLFTSISPLLERVALDSIRLHDTIVVDTDDSIHSRLKEIGISSIPLRSPGELNWETRDVAFKELAMPGVQMDKNFFGTTLPLWKVLSLDRYSFWYKGRQARMMYESVMALNWQKAYVPVDINHCLPFALARYSNREVVGVQTQPLRTREWLDLLNYGAFPFKRVIAADKYDYEYIGKRGVTAMLMEFSDPKPVPVTTEERKAMRAGLKIDGSIALVLFDSACEWEFRMSVEFLRQNYSKVFVYPIHHYDNANLQKLGILGGSIQAVDTLSVEPAADECIIFRYDASLLKGRRIPVRILDVSGRWLTAELSGG
jgi:hypothetical protein